MTTFGTSAENIAVAPGKEVSFTDADDTSAKNIWTPANGKRVVIHDVIAGLVNKSATDHILIVVQARIMAGWRTIFMVGANEKDGSFNAYNFGGRVHTDVGDGTAKIRIAKSGPSSSWEAFAGLTGHEI